MLGPIDAMVVDVHALMLFPPRATRRADSRASRSSSAHLHLDRALQLQMELPLLGLIRQTHTAENMHVYDGLTQDVGRVGAFFNLP